MIEILNSSMSNSDVKTYRIIDHQLYRGNHFCIKKYSFKNIIDTLHKHEYIQINYIYEGEGAHIINNQEFKIVQGDIFLIPPYVPHRIVSSNKSTLEIIEFVFELEFINKNFENIKDIESFFDFAYIEPFLVYESKVKPRLNLIGKTQIEVENILNKCLREFSDKTSGHELLIKALLLELLVIVGREYKKDLENKDNYALYNSHKNTVYAALKYIEDHFDEDLTIDDIAKRFSFSRSYFSYLFKSITLKTFSEYLIGLRISASKELLLKTNDSVIDICCKVGFKNVSHFSRLFKQHTGLSPLGYRKNH